jgi:Na+/melibiose symporter-like transporter
MKADVIDYDTYLTGEDRAAQFFAAWSFVTKMAIAIAPFFAFTYLDLIGFDSTPGALNSPEQILGLKLLFCFGLPLFLLIAILCVLNYPITQEKQEEIRKEIEVHKKQFQV